MIDIKEDPIHKLLEQFCIYHTNYSHSDPYYAEWHWKLESLYELTEEELNILHKRSYKESVQHIKIDYDVLYHLVKKLCK
jgi:hypothetical protein